MKKSLLVLSVVACGIAFGATPLYQVPFDGNETVISREGVKDALVKIAGRGEWANGKIGKGIHAARHAYDQVTAVQGSGFKNFNTRKGTLAFWFKPDWSNSDTNSCWIAQVNTSDRKFMIYITKGGRNNPKNRGEISICLPKQLQILFENDFWTKDKWMHLAFTWDWSKAHAEAYVNGKFYKEVTRIEAAKDPGPEKTTASFEFGQRGSDRFKSKPGDGVYDDFRIYDEVLTKDEIFLLASDADDAKMSAISLPGQSFSFVYAPTNRLASQCQLMRLYDAKGGKLIVSATGSEGRLAFTGISRDGEQKTFESADTILLDNGYNLSLGNVVMLDSAFQGRFEFKSPFGAFVKAEAVAGVKLSPPKEKSFAVASATAAETAADLYSFKGADRRTDGVRRGISLNAMWRLREADDFLGAPKGDFTYIRVPGNHRSTLYTAKKFGPDGKLVDAVEMPKYNYLSDSPRHRSAWYERPFEVPAEATAKGERVWLDFTDVSANAARIYVNGRQVRSFRRDWKFESLIPHQVRIDITEQLAANGKNVVTIYVDRPFFPPAWRPGVANSDDQVAPILRDVWLEFVPGKVAIANAQALPSVKRSNVLLKVRLDNAAGVKGEAEVKFVFARKGKAAKSFAKAVTLTGEERQKVEFAEKWSDPVLWTMEAPECYDLSVELKVAGALSDTLPARPFGFRELTIEDGNFLLNGTHCRFRMFTNHIQIDRMPYLYENRQGAEMFVSHLKDLGYDSTRCNPHRHYGHAGMEEFYTACDRLGFSCSLMMPQYTGQDLAEYNEVVERWFEAFGHHPSVMMWYTEFNDCCYAYDQDPSKLTDLEYEPKTYFKQLARKRADVAMATMRRYDPSRELFQHAGGNKGKVFGSMNYQSYGTPLKEQEDWPAQWAKGHKQPLMVVESGFPFVSQFDHFDNRQLGTFGAEHAARYFGDSVYGLEKKPVELPLPGYHYRSAHFGDDWTPSMALLSQLHYERVVKAWRAYDVSAIGDFPGTHDVARAFRTFAQQSVLRAVGGNPKSAGLKAENLITWCHNARMIVPDVTIRNTQYDSIRSCFEPLLVFAAGRPDAFTEKDHAFFAGEKFEKSIAVVNDHLYPVKLNYSWKCGELRGKGVIEVAGGGIVFEPIALVASEVSSRTEAKLEVEVTRDGLLVKRDALDLEFFPRHIRREFPRQARVGLYDPKGATKKLLDAAGLNYRKIASAADMKDITLLVIGQRALGEKADTLLVEIEKSGAIESGLSVLVFEQQAKAKMGGFLMTSPSYRDAFVRDAKSPYLAGLSARDFHDWRGDSDAVAAFVTADENSPHYPRSKWKCGNGGIVSGNVIRKPSYGRFATIVDSGFGLMFANLLEERKGRGRIVYCQLDVTCRYGKDPVATTLVDNILFELSKGYFTIGDVLVCYLGDDEGAKYLDRIGLKYDRLSERDQNFHSRFYAVAVLGKGAKIRGDWLANMQGIVVLPGGPIGSLPGKDAKLSWGAARDFKMTVPEGDVMFTGVTAADCYFRTPEKLKVVSGLPRWTASTAPAVIARHDYPQTHAAYILSMWPSEMKGLWNDERLSRVWNTVLSNMQLPLGKDHTVFSPSPWSCYIDNVDLYDVDAFHNW